MYVCLRITSAISTSFYLLLLDCYSSVLDILSHLAISAVVLLTALKFLYTYTYICMHICVPTCDHWGLGVTNFAFQPLVFFHHSFCFNKFVYILQIFDVRVKRLEVSPHLSATFFSLFFLWVYKSSVGAIISHIMRDELP